MNIEEIQRDIEHIRQNLRRIELEVESGHPFRHIINDCTEESRELLKDIQVAIGGSRKTIKRYRQKPVVVEAVQFTIQNWGEIHEWMWRYGAQFKMRTDDKEKANEIIIKTPGGETIAKVGDYIVKGVNGEFYTVNQSTFQTTYEEVKEYDEKQ